jgi:cytochrome c-type biogenesis protein CcmH/NrfG
MPARQPHSSDDAGLLAQARHKLRARPGPDRHWAALGAAAFFALCAMAFVVAAVLAPPLSHAPAAKAGVR